MPASSAALRAAIHGVLKNDGPLAAMLGGAKIYDEPPREAALPYVTLGETVVSDRSTSTEGGDEHALTLHVWSRQGGHREAHLISGAVMQALTDAPLAPTAIISRTFALLSPTSVARPTVAPITASCGCAP